MTTTNLRRIPAAVLALMLASVGCQTIGTAGRATGEAAGDTAEAAGKAASTAVRGAGDIIHDTAHSAEDEID
jgi:hypothetical protein